MGLIIKDLKKRLKHLKEIVNKITTPYKVYIIKSKNEEIRIINEEGNDNLVIVRAYEFD